MLTSIIIRIVLYHGLQLLGHHILDVSCLMGLGDQIMLFTSKNSFYWISNKKKRNKQNVAG